MKLGRDARRAPGDDGGSEVDNWKRSFLDKLNQAQGQCAQRFEDALEKQVVPAFDELCAFVRDHAFKVSTPLQERGRRSFKFELAENAYLLVIFRFSSVGEFELRSETFVPGADPALRRSAGRVADITEKWAGDQFRLGLDGLVELLAGQKPLAAAPQEELLAV